MAAPVHHNIGSSAQVPLLQAQSTPAIKPPRLSNHRLFEDAPSEDLQFAQTGTFTAAEIVTFFPKALKSHDIVHRLASNGMSNQIVADIINYHRVASFKGPVTNSALCHTMQKAMRDGMVLRGQTVPGTELVDADDEEDQKAWSKKLHEKLDLKNKDGPWDYKNLTLAGCHPQNFYRDQNFVANVQFKSLATGVNRFPSVQRGDGADLTRCVQYAVAHPDLNLSFPNDFAELTQFLGATTIGDEHYDGATFRRWLKDGAPNPPARSRFPRARVPALQPSSRPTAAQVMGRGRISKNTGGSTIDKTSLIKLTASEIDQAPTQAMETLRGSTPNFFDFQLAQDDHEAGLAAYGNNFFLNDLSDGFPAAEESDSEDVVMAKSTQQSVSNLQRVIDRHMDDFALFNSSPFEFDSSAGMTRQWMDFQCQSADGYSALFDEETSSAANLVPAASAPLSAIDPAILSPVDNVQLSAWDGLLLENPFDTLGSTNTPCRLQTTTTRSSDSDAYEKLVVDLQSLIRRRG